MAAGVIQVGSTDWETVLKQIWVTASPQEKQPTCDVYMPSLGINITPLPSLHIPRVHWGTPSFRDFNTCSRLNWDAGVSKAERDISFLLARDFRDEKTTSGGPTLDGGHVEKHGACPRPLPNSESVLLGRLVPMAELMF